MGRRGNGKVGQGSAPPNKNLPLVHTAARLARWTQRDQTKSWNLLGNDADDRRNADAVKLNIIVNSV